MEDVTKKINLILDILGHSPRPQLEFIFHIIN